VAEYDIFVSYAYEDLQRVLPVVQALESEGWRVFWARKIPPGETWRSFIERPLIESPVVLVAWSHQSIKSDFVAQEADHAKERNALIPVSIDPVMPPLGLRHIQVASLVEWLVRQQTSLPSELTTAIKRKLAAVKDAPISRNTTGPSVQSVTSMTTAVSAPAGLATSGVAAAKKLSPIVPIVVIGSLLCIASVGGVWLSTRIGSTETQIERGKSPGSSTTGGTASTDGDGRWFGSYRCADRQPFSVDVGIRNGFEATVASGTTRASSISVRIRGEDVYISRHFAGGEATIVGRYRADNIQAHGDEQFGDKDCTVVLNRIER
jgi:hypothetical protein